MAETTVLTSADIGELKIGAPSQGRPLHKPFICPGCGEPCPFPTQAFDFLKDGQSPHELMSTCGCGMTHKLTLEKGRVSEVPAGVTIDKGWRAKKDDADRAAREKEAADLAKELEGKCPHCRQALPAKAGG